jgi:uncharacterized protein YciI
VADSSTFMNKTLYVITTVPCAPREEMMKHIDAHLDRQVELEQKGIMFGAGPLFDADDSDRPVAGMIIVRADSMEHAREIADGDPMHIHGVRTYTIQRWRMNEGSFNVTISYSTQRAEIG